MTEPTLTVEDFFVEKHNAYRHNGEEDTECNEYKAGIYQTRIASVHYRTEEERRCDFLTSLYLVHI